MKMPFRKMTTTPDDATPLIAILGLGEVGAAMGLALQAVKTRYSVVGYDVEPGRVRAALEGRAIDRADRDPIAVASQADLIFLCEPLDALCATLETVAPHTRPGTLLTDTAAWKSPVMTAAARCVPAGVTFVGGHPILRRPAGAATSMPSVEGVPESWAAPFAGATYCLCPAPGADEVALDVLRSLIASIGAQPYFIDPDEHDALVMGTAALPALVGSALFRVLSASPSSRDLRRLAGAPLQTWLDLAAGPDVADAWPGSLPVDPRLAVAWLDRVVAELEALRPALLAGDAAAIAAWSHSAEGALPQWRAESPAGAADAAGTAEALDDAVRDNPLSRLLFGQRRRRREAP